MKGSQSIPGSSGRVPARPVRLIQRVMNYALGPLGLGVRSRDEVDILDRAIRHDYYWYNAHKKRDIREIKDFGRLARYLISRRRTYLSYDRLYTLWQAVGRLGDDAPLAVEVGAYQGGSARFIAEALRRHGRSNPLYVFDTFEGHAVVDASVDGKHDVGRQFRDTSLERVAAYLRDFPNVQVVKGDFCETARTLDGLGPVALAHVDVDVYPVTLFALNYLADRLVTGGIVVVDDYGFRRTKGAWKAVEEFVETRADYCRLHLLTGQAVLIRLHHGTT